MVALGIVYSWSERGLCHAIFRASWSHARLFSKDALSNSEESGEQSSYQPQGLSCGTSESGISPNRNGQVAYAHSRQSYSMGKREY